MSYIELRSAQNSDIHCDGTYLERYESVNLEVTLIRASWNFTSTTVSDILF